MSVTVRFPAMLHATAGKELVIDEHVHDMASVLSALDRRVHGLAGALQDPIYNVAVNDVMLLHGVRQHPIADGDVVEIVPTIAGG
jgi:molybdopterin converting factor small subunit